MNRKPFVDFQELKVGTHKIVELIKQLTDKESQRLVMPNVQAGFLRAAFPDYAPEEGTSLDDCVQDLKNICYPGILNWGSPRFFAYFPCRNSTTAFLSELFSTAYHTPGFMYAMSPSHTELENVVVDWTVKALGLPNYFLLENEGGSVLSSAITQSIIIIVHTAKRRKIKQLGLPLNSPQILKFVGYYPQFSHPATEKALFLKDVFERRAVPCYFCEERKNFAIDPEKFKQIIQQDVKNGFIPFFYGFAHGATFSCSSDLSIEIVEICEKYKIWMNIDAAYLGATWLCPEYRVDQNIIEKVDSICLNFAKAMHMGNGGSFMFIKNKKQLIQSMIFAGDTKFSFYNNEFTGKNDIFDYKLWIPGSNRRASQFRLFFLYKYYGLQRLRQYIRQIVEKTEHLVNLVEKNKNMKMWTKPEFGLVLFKICNKEGIPDEEITKKVQEKVANIEEGYLTAANYKENYAIRICICNEQTTINHIQAYFNKIIQVAESVIFSSKEPQQ